MDDLTGKQFGAYQIISPFGEGGMATVYKAYQPSMDRYVALKVLPRFHSLDEEFLGRFQQEAKALAQLQHPHILPIYDFGESEGYTYFVMPLMQDGNLAECLNDERLSLDRIHQVISQVGSALEFAHSRGFIHRDVKPSNILLDESGNCMLMDFGVAKIIEGSKEFTRTGGIIGTPVYMSPEQGSGRKIDSKSDIYSLGIILYETATGRPPFEAETPVAIIFKHVHDPLPPPSSINPEITEEVEQVILKSLAKDPSDRYETVREMVDALSRAVTASQRIAPTEVELTPTVRENLPDAESAVPDLPEKELPHEEISTRRVTSDEDTEKLLQELYTKALSAYWLKDWENAARRFKGIAKIDPDYKGITSKLEESERQVELTSLYSQAQASMETEEWGVAHSALQKLVAIAPDYKDAATKLEEVNKTVRVTELYAEAQRLSRGKQWQAVVNVFSELASLDPEFSDPEGLLEGAEREITKKKEEDEIEELYSRAILQLDARNWLDAQELFEQILEKDPEFHEAQKLLERIDVEIQREREELESDEEMAVGARPELWEKIRQSRPAIILIGVIAVIFVGVLIVGSGTLSPRDTSDVVDETATYLTAGIPAEVSNFIKNPQVVFLDEFDELDSKQWLRSEIGLLGDEGVVSAYYSGSPRGFITNRDEMLGNKAILVSFKLEAGSALYVDFSPIGYPGSAIYMLLDSTDYGPGMGVSSAEDSPIYFQGNLVMEPSNWYHLLTLQEGGDEFFVWIWGPDGAEDILVGYYQADYSWRENSIFQLQDTGGTLHINSYAIFRHEGVQ
jgi:serine/threonine protein kinase